MVEQMALKCPHCSVVYETHAIGDIEACDHCGEVFKRFMNSA